jgi:trk system potassium uptake protein
VSDSHSILEVVAGNRMAGKSIVELDVRANYGVNIEAINQMGALIFPRVPISQNVKQEDILIIILELAFSRGKC